MLVWRSVASNALTLFIVLLIGAAIGVAMAQNAWRSPGPLTEAICLSVPRGATLHAVSEDLADKGAVGSAALLRIGADYTEKSGDLKAGNWLIPEGASPESIVDLITRGGANTCGSELLLLVGVTDAEVRVRELDPATGQFEVTAQAPLGAEMPAEVASLIESGFPSARIVMAEGVTSWQVAETLRQAPFLSGEIAEVPAEGSLAPGSYEVRMGGARTAILAAMETRQQDILTAAWAGRQPGLPLESAYEALILASIIEKETAVAEERRWVSSVFINRLNDGMRLQTDPTVIYGITEGRGTLDRGIRRSELAQATPYNTYVIDGLPPTPIANPGRAAIEAAVNPADTEFLFFVADGTGGHVFARTFEEHRVNVQRWRAIEAQRNQ